jgi:L-rhamnose mutarotase
MIRRAFTMRLKPDSLAEYKFHHDNIWPELVAEIERSGIASITTFQRDLDLFLISEIADEAAWDKLWSSPVHQRWAEVMQPLMHLREDGIVEAGELVEVFHLTTGDNGQAILDVSDELASDVVMALVVAPAEEAMPATPAEPAAAPAPKAAKRKKKPAAKKAAKKSSPKKKAPAKKGKAKAKKPAAAKTVKKAAKKKAGKKPAAKKATKKKKPAKKSR